MKALLASLLLAVGCGRYAEFHLPILDRQPPAGEWTWKAQPGPVIARGPDPYDAIDALNPSVVRHRDVYFNFYSAFDGKTWRTALATSADGVTWSKKGSILSPEAWEGDYIGANGAALRTADQFLYWYQVGRTPRIALASSHDGTRWRKHPPRPVLDVGPRGSWDERGVADPYVIRLGGEYYMYYLGQDRAMRQRLGVARSDDGIVWTRHRQNPLLELGEYGRFDERGLGEPAVFASRGSYWMLYTGRDIAENRRMGLARSQDGVRWTKIAAPIIAGHGDWNANVVCDATVEVTAEAVRVWFGGGNRPSPDERLNGQIGLGVLRWKAR